jgi:hypothetical protein
MDLDAGELYWQPAVALAVEEMGMPLPRAAPQDSEGGGVNIEEIAAFV